MKGVVGEDNVEVEDSESFRGTGGTTNDSAVVVVVVVVLVADCAAGGTERVAADSEPLPQFASLKPREERPLSAGEGGGGVETRSELRTDGDKIGAGFDTLRKVSARRKAATQKPTYPARRRIRTRLSDTVLSRHGGDVCPCRRQFDALRKRR